MEQGEKRRVDVSSSKLDIGEGPGKGEANLIISREGAFPRNLIIFFFLSFFFLNRGRSCHSESPRLFCKQAKINSPLVEDK